MKTTYRVPATSANLGPGFDCLGIALNLYNDYTFYFGEDGEDNLMVRAAQLSFEKAGKTMPPLRVETRRIFISRGLGSSAACIVAGLMAANDALDEPYIREEILTMATALEGHPDNVAPAIYGGVTAAADTEKGVVFQRFIPKISWDFVAFIPPVELSTAEARRVLPKQIPYKDAVWNASHSIFVALALLQGDYDLLCEGLQDRLHEPYRKPLIPKIQDLEQALKDFGEKAIYLSGAGPTVICISRQGEALQDWWREQPLSSNWKAHLLRPDKDGAKRMDKSL